MSVLYTEIRGLLIPCPVKDSADQLERINEIRLKKTSCKSRAPNNHILAISALHSS